MLTSIVAGCWSNEQAFLFASALFHLVWCRVILVAVLSHVAVKLYDVGMVRACTRSKAGVSSCLPRARNCIRAQRLSTVVAAQTSPH